MTPAERRLRAQIAANTRWSREDPAVNAARGQAGLWDRFMREADPDGTLAPGERHRRAAAAYKAHFQRLAFASAKARAARAGGAADAC